MEAMHFGCSWCQMLDITPVYRLNTKTYMYVPYNLLYIYFLFYIFWPVFYKNLPIQLDDCYFYFLIKQDQGMLD